VLSPNDPVVAGSCASWTLAVTVGDYGLGAGSEIAVVRRSTCDTELPQFSAPRASGYTTVETDGEAKLEIRFDRKLYRAPWRAGIAVRIADGMLKPGERVTIRLGDPRQGSPGMQAQTFPQSNHRFRVLVAHIGTGDFREIEQDTQTSIIAGPPETAQLVVPSRVTVGEAFDVRARALDRWGNPSPSLGGTLSLVPTEGVRVERAEPAPLAREGGVSVIARATVTAAGCFRLRATGDFEAESNPVMATPESAQALPVFWSDMHWQSDSTVGIGSVEECLSYARDRALIDVTAWQGNDFQITPDGWTEARRETARFNRPGRFVVFGGYEYSPLRPAGGDHNIYFLGDDSDFFPSCLWQNDQFYDVGIERPTMRDLSAQFRGRDDVMVIPHVGGRACNLDYFDQELMPVIEIFSHHGSFEWLAKEALRRGLLVGFVAAGDDHTGRPGLTSPTALFGGWNTSLDLTGGYTGIYAAALTREEIWKAIRARHCFATTGARILLDVRMGEKMMGDVVEGTSSARLEVSVFGTAPLLEVEVLRATEVVYRHPLAQERNDSTCLYAIYWRGPIKGPCAGKVRWKGSMALSHGRIERLETMGFRKLGDRIRRSSNGKLNITSTTSGNGNGVLIECDASPDVELTFATEALSFRLPLSDMDSDRRTFTDPSRSCEVVVRKLARPPTLREVTFTYTDEPPPGMNPYWVRLLQIDGNEAWSSPIYLRTKQTDGDAIEGSAQTT